MQGKKNEIRRILLGSLSLGNRLECGNGGRGGGGRSPGRTRRSQPLLGCGRRRGGGKGLGGMLGRRRLKGRKMGGLDRG